MSGIEDADRARSGYVMPCYSGDWRCLKCGENVADEQIAVPESCPECGGQSFGRYLPTGSDCTSLVEVCKEDSE